MASSSDYKAHKSTYGGFLNLMKWGTIVVVLLTALVILLIA